MALSFNINSLKALTPSQKDFDYSLWTNTISIGVGEAGSGKTTRALQAALKHINSSQFGINRIVYVRPHTQEPDELDLGAFPGPFEEKIMCLANPLISPVKKLLSPEELNKFYSILEVYNISTLKGMTLENAFIIFDEAEDATDRLFKSVLTRIGQESKMAIIGDLSQTTLKTTPYLQTVAYHYLYQPVEDLGVVIFPEGSCVRNPIIPKILSSLP